MTHAALKTASIADLAAALLARSESTCDALTALAVAVDRLSADSGLDRCPIQDSIAASLAELADANREAEQSTM